MKKSEFKNATKLETSSKAPSVFGTTEVLTFGYDKVTVSWNTKKEVVATVEVGTFVESINLDCGINKAWQDIFDLYVAMIANNKAYIERMAMEELAQETSSLTLEQAQDEANQIIEYGDGVHAYPTHEAVSCETQEPLNIQEAQAIARDEGVTLRKFDVDNQIVKFFIPNHRHIIDIKIEMANVEIEIIDKLEFETLSDTAHIINDTETVELYRNKETLRAVIKSLKTTAKLEFIQNFR